MNSNLTNDLTNDVRKIYETIDTKWWGICIFYFIQLIAIIILMVIDLVWHRYNKEFFKGDIICFIILGGISLGILILNYLSLIRIQTISQYIVLTAGYERAIQEINKNAHSTETKIKHTVTLYQHYCQSLTKR